MRWNRDLKKQGVDFEIKLPDHKFNRNQGVYAGLPLRAGRSTPISESEGRQGHTWLPSQADRDYVKSCMVAVLEPGKFANYISPPARGVNDTPQDFEYVKFH